MGIGVGIAIGPTAVGTIGYEGRIDHTANANVVNLASRLCCGAMKRRCWWMRLSPNG
jgi:class 3 adenylate cyclase